MAVPVRPKLYHILHVDRLRSVLADGYLFCDARMVDRNGCGTTIGMSGIKQRRLELPLHSHPDLHVGECVPFYFCSRSVMLYLLHRGNDPGLAYRSGQEPILHLECDMQRVVAWAREQNLRWAFTLSNAGAYYFEDRCDLAQLGDINWEAVQARKWAGAGVPAAIKEGKQAEFLVEKRFPWSLVERIGTHSRAVAQQVANALGGAEHRPRIEIKQEWYY